MSGNKVVLPQPGDDLRAWAQQLVAALQLALGANELGGTSLPIFDAQGRPIVTLDGLYAYDANGNAPIQPNIVQIDTDHLVDAAITTQKLANLAVDTSKLADLAVDAAKLADSAVTATKIANAAVGSAAIANAAIGSVHIGNGVILNAHIGDAEIQDAKIANVAANKIISGVIASAVIDIFDNKFRFDSANQILEIRDANGTLRAKIGKLGAGTQDYGIEIYDAAGALIFSSGRSFDSSLVDALQTQNAPAEAGATKNTIFYQATAPTATSTGDLWFNTSTQVLHRWDGAAWVRVGNDFTDTAQLTDGARLGETAIWAQITGAGKPEDGATKNTIFRQSTAPTGTAQGDIWFDTSTSILYRWDGTSWVRIGNDYTATSQLTDDAGLGQTAIWSQITGAGKPQDYATRNDIYRQSTAPTANSTGDLWFDTSTNNLYRWDGASWVYVGNYVTATSELTDDAGLGQTAVWSQITGTGKPQDNATKNTIYRQASPPSGSFVDGDLWFDTDADLLYRWDSASSSWVYIGSYGAKLGTNLKDSAGNVRGDADFAASFNPITSSNVSTFIANAAIQAAQIGTAQIQDAHLDRATANRIQIQTADIVDAAITNAKLDRASVDKIQIGTADIVDLSVTRIKISDGAVNTIATASYSSTDVPITSTGNVVDKLMINGPQLPSSVLAPYVIIAFELTIGPAPNADIGPLDDRVIRVGAYWVTDGSIDEFIIDPVDLKLSELPCPITFWNLPGPNIVCQNSSTGVTYTAMDKVDISGSFLLPFVPNATPTVGVNVLLCPLSGATSLPVTGYIKTVLAEK